MVQVAYVIVLIQSALPIAICDDVKVRIKNGIFVGTTRSKLDEIGSNIDVIEEFLGVPYATPPTGQHRFHSAEVLESIVGTKNAKQYGKSCPQLPLGYSPLNAKKAQDENCLCLNIHTPRLKLTSGKNGTFPVLFFIHGGSYIDGTGGLYSGYVLAHYNVVVVTINYRLGLLGFLTDGGRELAGNYGLQDQVAALMWIRKNIANFRGNPDHVTVWGSSAGAASAGLLMFCPEAKGLFHAAILQSGSPLGVYAVHNKTADLAGFTEKVFGCAGCQESSANESVKCLKSLPTKRILDLEYGACLSERPMITQMGLPFKPWIDGTVIPDAPEKLLKRGQLHKVPVVIGFTADEWAHHVGGFLDQDKAQRDDYHQVMTFDQLRENIRHVIEDHYWWPRRVTEAVWGKYTANLDKSDQSHVYWRYVEFVSDLVMLAPAVKTASLLAYQGVPVYLYVYDHKPSNLRRLGNHNGTIHRYGVYHTLDLNYAFGAPYSGQNIPGPVSGRDPEPAYDDFDKRISSEMMTLWTNFAKYREPCQRRTCALNTTWFRLNPAVWNYLHIQTGDTSIATEYRVDKMDFWNYEVERMIKEINTKRQELPQNFYAGIGIGIFMLCILILANVCYFKRRRKEKKIEKERHGVEAIMLEEMQTTTESGETEAV